MPHDAITVGFEQGITVGGHAVQTVFHGIGKAQHPFIQYESCHIELSVTLLTKPTHQIPQQSLTLLAVQAIVILQKSFQQPLFFLRSHGDFAALAGSQAGQHILHSRASRTAIGTQPIPRINGCPGLHISILRGFPLCTQLPDQFHGLPAQRHLAHNSSMPDGGIMPRIFVGVQGVKFFIRTTFLPNNAYDTLCAPTLCAQRGLPGQDPPVVLHYLFLGVSHTKPGSHSCHKIH